MRTKQRDCYKPHINPTGMDDYLWRCEFMRKEDDIVQGGYGDTPEQAYQRSQIDKDSCTQGNAFLDRINNASR